MDKTDSNRDEIRIRSNDVCYEQVVDDEPKIDISKLIETLDCE